MPYWYKGENEPNLGDRQRAGLKALAAGAQGVRRGIHNYRDAGLMGVIDPEGENERQKAEQEHAELQARLGQQEDIAEADALPETAPDEGEGSEFSGNPRDWLTTLADLGGGALGAVAQGPGGEHQRSLVELARLRGSLAQKQDDLARARALSATVAGSTDPGAVLGRVAPSLGFGKGDIAMRRKGGEDPRSAWGMAWHIARTNAAKEGREPTDEEVSNSYYLIRMNEQTIDESGRQAPKASTFEQKKAMAERILTERKGRPPTEEEVYKFLQERPPSEGLQILDRLLGPGAGGKPPPGSPLPAHGAGFDDGDDDEPDDDDDDDVSLYE